METHQIYLVPGFFGFANFGELKYFAHVRRELEAFFRPRSEHVSIHYVPTLPTAALHRRSERLASVIRETRIAESRIHIIGHSSGGLDARMLCTPQSQWSHERYVSQIDSVVTIATPHAGVPQVSSLTGAVGSALLRTLSLLTLHSLRFGSVPLSSLVAMAGVLPRVGTIRGPLLSILNQVYGQLLKDFDDERQEALEAFLRETNQDQGLLPQLAPEAMQVFGDANPDNPSIRYASVAVQARPPSWRSAAGLGLTASGQATYALYRALHTVASTMGQSALPKLSTDQRAQLEEGYGAMPSASANDAIVPTLSQVHGELLHTTWADHLDVVGHFGEDSTDPPHVEWLHSRSGFDLAAFQQLWSKVAQWVVGG